jgi:hypothetical protein
MPAGWKTFRNAPPQTSHVVSASSLNFWNTSTCRPHDWQAYS